MVVPFPRMNIQLPPRKEQTMPPESNARLLIKRAMDDFPSAWMSLVLTNIIFKVIAFIVLTPLVGILFRTLIAISGRAVVSDLDILFFFLGPVGWICAGRLNGDSQLWVTERGRLNGDD